MSIISNIHTAIVYQAKGQDKSVAQFGQRGVVTIAKADKEGNYGPHLQQTMFTSIPQMIAGEIDWNDVRVKNHAVEYFKSVQNSIISDSLKSGAKSVTSEQIDINSVCTYLECVNSPEKWDSAKIASWFQETLAEQIGVALIERGFDDAKLEKSLVAYSKLFADSFSSKAAIPRIKAEAIRKALSLVNDSKDAQVLRFKARIDKTLEENNLDELLGL